MCSLCTILSDGNTVLAIDGRESPPRKREQRKKTVHADTEVCLYKAQISSGISKTTVTLERFSPCGSLRISTTSESTCSIKFLIICLRASECPLQGYGGAASALYGSPGACDNVRYTELYEIGRRRTTNRGPATYSGLAVAVNPAGQ